MNSQVHAIKTSGQLWGWGSNDFGTILSSPINRKRSSPTNIGSGSSYNKAFSNSNTAFVSKTDGTMWAWGYNNVGQVGLNDTPNNTSPRQIGTHSNWNIDIGVMNNNATSAIKTDGTLWMWGTNFKGVLGHNNEV